MALYPTEIYPFLKPQPPQPLLVMLQKFPNPNLAYDDKMYKDKNSFCVLPGTFSNSDTLFSSFMPQIGTILKCIH